MERKQKGWFSQKVNCSKEGLMSKGWEMVEATSERPLKIGETRDFLGRQWWPARAFPRWEGQQGQKHKQK